jgi:hypothetical protein
MKFPFPTIAAAFRERHIVRQPIPDVTEKDVERIVRRDFPREQYDAVMRVLREYSQGRLPKECSRVHLAALKLAQGDLELLGLHIGHAELDFRDVLAAAEYPEYMSTVAFRVSKLPRKEQLRIFNSDWDQYAKWLQK